MGCKLRRGDDGGHRHHERRCHRLRMEPRLKDSEMVHVKEKRLWASFKSELVKILLVHFSLKDCNAVGCGFVTQKEVQES